MKNRSKFTSNLKRIEDLSIQSSSRYTIRASNLNSPKFSPRNSPYRTHQTCILSMTQTQRFEHQRYCQQCPLDVGFTQHYCKCNNCKWHDRCFQNWVKSRAKLLFEGAFLCNHGCQMEYLISARFVKDITIKAKLYITLLATFLFIFLSLLIAISFLWEQFHLSIRIIFIMIQIFILLTTIIIIQKIKVNVYKIYWKILPYSEEEQIKKTKISLRVVLPFILQDRDVLEYNEEVLDQVLEQ